MTGPERFLRSADLARHLGKPHLKAEDAMAYDAIQGILNFEQLEEWIRTERTIGPRRKVMEWLRARNDELLDQDYVFEGKDTYDERDRAELQRRARELYELRPDTDAADEPLSASEKIRQIRDSQAVATDGGEEQ